ncbi:Crp/Fnr family transcriptional regulator [Larkinella knui]|uniref:Crp/Fnr family transcriptional regulator n=1 Tax=Larkinella knui TaxID=2025310 RepID=A0A3P1CUS0_9BACT|nr:Crp/Fnr family transcriptional regulator [Larkinella knui]RRB16998.1 Crp/Fnr family transcriptional regulator [Larkinella knui]
MEELENFIKSTIQVDTSALVTIVSNFKVRSVAKGKFILKQGHIATDYFFIKSGAIRIYYDADDKQITGWIALENEFFTELSSLKSQKPSRFTIQTLEDTVLLTITNDKMEKLYKQYPEWQQFGRLVWETAFLKVIDGILDYQTKTAEERYLTALERSDLLQRVPLKHLSSYLGITPTSLSRLRKNIK